MLCSVSCLFIMVIRLRNCTLFFFLMIRRPPRSTLDRSSAASDVYKRQELASSLGYSYNELLEKWSRDSKILDIFEGTQQIPVSYTHLRAHETVLDLVCRLLLEKKKKNEIYYVIIIPIE